MTIYARREQVRVPQEGPRPQTAPYIHRVSANEQWLERRLGEMADSRDSGATELRRLMRLSTEMHIPLPVFGCGAYVMQDSIMPVVKGGAGFASLSDLISEATTGGKLQRIAYNKVGVTGRINAGSTTWYEGVIPGVGATAAALAAGTNFDMTSVGAIGPQVTPAGGDTLHVIGDEGNVSVVSMGHLLMDRIWGGELAATTTGAQTVTMTATRYAGTAADGSGTSTGNVAWMESRLAPGAATPTITLNYSDEKGNAGENAPTLVGITSAIIKSIPYNGQLFFTLNSGDRGISDIVTIGLSASWLTTPSVSIYLGHPLMYIPGLAVANAGYIRDGINSAFNFQRIYDNACLMILEDLKPASTATTYMGALTLCAG